MPIRAAGFAATGAGGMRDGEGAVANLRRGWDCRGAAGWRLSNSLP